ncbi:MULTISPECIES: N-acetyl-alpha-D-glucosaminyl L-malate synthase BshA [Corallincola]|uniref:N-acetyl-alpha-D-glucosaminyl L-malate synthase BshA n=3 Tax=Corallincola TaxID=1775176 RepID=A0A368NHB1_9GAMM|nr:MULTISPECIES: N-acetyl-alpha-D-glucosaminyl L-malate synthase BshA [Corallincola]RCU49977.1 N-acetyl-alpha-D-glucosaminyl L-malate synthase BshA [Corallincola holothuriorum]TAA45045.1 N-acetyl-alpha-D-glucosaminyl L-malate synthase BshA [Corallincola spongiicola]TCI03675.1 N-acetyl-alpha-D-glucosaminyl L-malate synthase BshA [Corallincola luteus]
MAEKPSLKIAIICRAGMGGSSIMATTLALRLAERGHQIYLFATDRPFNLKNAPDNLRFVSVNLPKTELLSGPPETLATSGTIERYARKIKFDIIHSHYAVPYALSAEMARQVGGLESKLVITLHGTDVSQLGNTPSMRPPIKWALQKADAITAVSKNLQQLALKTYGSDLNIDTIYNFLVEKLPLLTAAERKAMRAKFDIDEDENVLVHASNFRTVKRTDDIIDAFYRVCRTHHAKLVLFGDGPQRPHCEHLAHYLGIADKVIFAGKVKECGRWLGIGDINLLLSAEESFGLVLLEGFSQHVPAVATNVGGIPEVLIDGENGFLCEATNPIDAGRKIRVLLNDRELLQTMAEKAPDILEDFSEEAILNQYEALYMRLLEQ